MAAETTGLTRAELRIWRRFLNGVSGLFRALDRDLRDNSGVSLDDFGLLRPLWESRDSALTMSQLADELGFSPSRTSHAVERMEAKGWVTREPSPDDGRVKLVKLTPAGTEIFHEVWPDHANLVRELFLAQMTSEERATLVAVFARVSEASRTQSGDTDEPQSA